jgi:anti-sigma factor (TIGR02949 family)
MQMDNDGMIDCKEAERRLHRYLDRELTEEEAAEVRQHLSMCDNCRARFRFEDGLRRVVRRVGQAERAPAELRERIRSLGRKGGS